MAKYTEEDLNKIRDNLKSKYNYDQRSDEEKKQIDDMIDSKFDEARKNGLVEGSGDNDNDNTDNTDDDDVENDNDKDRERTPEGGGSKKEEEEKTEDTEEDAVKKKEMEKLDSEIGENQRKIDAEKQRKADEAEKKEKDRGDYDR